jgi:hypothetical protein
MFRKIKSDPKGVGVFNVQNGRQNKGFQLDLVKHALNDKNNTIYRGCKLFIFAGKHFRTHLLHIYYPKWPPKWPTKQFVFN